MNIAIRPNTRQPWRPRARQPRQSISRAVLSWARFRDAGLGRGAVVLLGLKVFDNLGVSPRKNTISNLEPLDCRVVLAQLGIACACQGLCKVIRFTGYVDRVKAKSNAVLPEA